MQNKAPLNGFERGILKFFHDLGNLNSFAFRFFKAMWYPPYDVAEIMRHMYELGVKTMPIVSVTGIIIGLVLAMQSQPVLARFGAESFLPAMVTISVVRELGPVLTAVIFAGRVSSGIGAELGSMRVTEQIDAMEVSAINPFKYLVVTRIIATTAILPILTMYSIFLSVLGCYIAIILFQPMTISLYIGAVIDSIKFADFIPGMAKTIIFGFIVGLVGTEKGYNAQNGTEGVGVASTTAVVVSSLLILITDTVLVKLSLVLWPTV
ncbi:MAG: ABC transporter permease [Ignavibacteria bacterium]|nr:ABC transporter permease [Ignavibacteria bacterium]